MNALRQRVSGLLGNVQDRWERTREQHPPKATIALNLRPVRSSWGGGNQWAQQMTRFLRRHGYAVRFDLKNPVDIILLIDPRLSHTVSFGLDAIGLYKREHPDTRVVHRINENDQRKGTTFMDDLLSQANALADFTVFVSGWLRDYHAQRWFDVKRPHRVILNGADPRVFHPRGQVPWDGKEALRLVTHHWSDNPMKGFAIYSLLDQWIAENKIAGVKLVVIGRWPPSIRWKTAELHPPTHGHKLAELLRTCHAYITASQWDPGPMHVAEGLQCGLPILYHVDGGGIVEMARPFGVGFQENVIAAIQELKDHYKSHRAALLQGGYSGEQMCEQYLQIIQTI